MEALTNVIEENNEKELLPSRRGDDGAPCTIARLVLAQAWISNQQKPNHKNLSQKMAFHLLFESNHTKYLVKYDCATFVAFLMLYRMLHASMLYNKFSYNTTYVPWNSATSRRSNICKLLADASMFRQLLQLPACELKWEGHNELKWEELTSSYRDALN